MADTRRPLCLERGGKIGLARVRLGQGRRAYAWWRSAVTPCAACHFHTIGSPPPPPATNPGRRRRRNRRRRGCCHRPRGHVRLSQSAYARADTPTQPPPETPSLLVAREEDPTLHRHHVSGNGSPHIRVSLHPTRWWSLRRYGLAIGSSLGCLPLAPRRENGRQVRSGPRWRPRRVWRAVPSPASPPSLWLTGAMLPFPREGGKAGGMHRQKVRYEPHRQPAAPPPLDTRAVQRSSNCSVSPCAGKLPVCPRVWPPRCGGGGEPPRHTAATACAPVVRSAPRYGRADGRGGSDGGAGPPRVVVCRRPATDAPRRGGRKKRLAVTVPPRASATAGRCRPPPRDGFAHPRWCALWGAGRPLTPTLLPTPAPLCGAHRRRLSSGLWVEWGASSRGRPPRHFPPAGSPLDGRPLY